MASRIRFHAVCIICSQDIFAADGLIAYTVRRGIPEVVALNGKDPWAGVRVICRHCREFVGTATVEVPRG